jgi:hypothetical protein
MLAHEIGHGARVERAGSRAHEQSIEGGKAHRRVDATPIAHRAQASTIAEVGDNHTTVCEIGVDHPQPLRDELVRQTMKTVSSHTFFVIDARQPKPASDGLHCLMKCRVKACDLRHVRLQRRAGAYSRQVMRLVQRSERLQLGQLLHHPIVDADRHREGGSAVHDAVADRPEHVAALLCKPCEKPSQEILVGEPAAGFAKAAVDHHVAAGFPRREMRGNPDLLDLAAQELPQVHSGR